MEWQRIESEVGESCVSQWSCLYGSAKTGIDIRLGFDQIGSIGQDICDGSAHGSLLRRMIETIL